MKKVTMKSSKYVIMRTIIFSELLKEIIEEEIKIDEEVSTKSSSN